MKTVRPFPLTSTPSELNVSSDVSNEFLPKHIQDEINQKKAQDRKGQEPMTAEDVLKHKLGMVSTPNLCFEFKFQMLWVIPDMDWLK